MIAPFRWSCPIRVCSWLMVRVLLADRLFRRSSNMRSASACSSDTTGRPSPCNAATQGAQASSIRSFLRRLPGDSSRTRAVAVVGTSTTVSPQPISHRVRCRPNPWAFSTAHRRCGHCLAQAIKRLYPDSVASMRIEPRSALVAGSTAVAVWVRLGGSTPRPAAGNAQVFAPFGRLITVPRHHRGHRFASRGMTCRPTSIPRSFSDARTSPPADGRPHCMVSRARSRTGRTATRRPTGPHEPNRGQRAVGRIASSSAAGCRRPRVGCRRCRDPR